MDDKEFLQESGSEESLDGFSLEDILKEFGDETEPVAEKTPEEILSAVEEEVHRELAPEEPEPAVTGETIRFEKITDVKGTVRNAAPILEEEEQTQPEIQEEAAEPYSEEWEPEYEQPIAEYVPPNPILFRPRSRLRELKKKLVEGPEKMYYDMLEQGLGKLQLAIFVSVLLVLVCAAATAMYAFRLVPDHRLRLMVFTQFWAMLVSALLGSFQLIDGVSDLFRGKFSLNTMLVFTFLLCCVDGVLCLRQLRVPCCAAFSLQVTMSLWSSYHKRVTRMGKLDTMRKATQLDSLTAVDDYHEAGKGLIRGEGRVEDFMDTLDDSCRMEKATGIYAIIATCLSVAVGVTAGVLHDVTTGIQVTSVAMLAALPASMFVAISRPAAVLEKRHHAMGTVLCGWQGVEGLCGKALFPVDHSDLLPAGSIKLNGVKFFGSRQPDEVVAYAAALVIRNGGSMEHLFTHLLESRNGVHYEAQQLRVYENGGIGGQVNGEAVLAGSIHFLRDMGVEVPKGVMVHQSVCVAIEGELCGLFAVTYEKDKAGLGAMGTLCAYRGLKTVVTTDDFMITEEFIEEHFGVKTRRVLFPEYGERTQLREKKPDESKCAQALVTHNGLAPFAYAVTGARALKNASVAGTVVHMVGGGLGIAMMLALGILGATELLTPANLFLYELVWLIPGFLISEWTRSA